MRIPSLFLLVLLFNLVVVPAMAKKGNHPHRASKTDLVDTSWLPPCYQECVPAWFNDRTAKDFCHAWKIWHWHMKQNGRCFEANCDGDGARVRRSMINSWHRYYCGWPRDARRVIKAEVVEHGWGVVGLVES